MQQFITRTASVVLVNVSMWVCLCLQALLYDYSPQNLVIELFDEDTDKDDYLGRYHPL